MKFGAHCPIANNYISVIDYTKSIGGNTAQIFSSSPRMWKKKEINNKIADNFKYELKKNKITPLIVHCSYLINIASPDKKLRDKSVSALKAELVNADKLGAEYIILHPGSHTGIIREEGIKNIIDSIRSLDLDRYNTKLLLENSAGQGNTISGDLTELADLIRNTEENIFLCLDTAHAFEYGYDLSKISKMDISPLIKVIHINDSKTEKGSKKDRHEHIGKGHINKNIFRHLIRSSKFKNLPFIIETPWEDDLNKKSIQILKKLSQEKL